MRILLLQDTDWIERYPHTQHHLMERLSLKGHEIRVIDFDLDWKRKEQTSVYKQRVEFHEVRKIYPGARVEVVRPSAVHIPVLSYGYLLYSHYFEIKRQILLYKPDIVIGFGILSAYCGSVLACRHHIPFVYYWIDALDTLIPEKLFQVIGRFFERRTIRNSAALFVTNEKLKDHVAELGADRAGIRIFSSGIDFSRFHAHVDGSELRRQHGFAESDIVLLFMGWIYHFSGLKELSRYLGENMQSYPQVKLLVVGDGDAYEELKVIRTAYSLENQLILTGRQPYESIPCYIAASDYCILPAYPDEKIMQDIVPIKIIEYLALGKPVIATRLPGLIREFGEGKGVFYVDRPEDTVKASLLLHTSPDSSLTRDMAKNSVRMYDWNRIGDNFEQALLELVRTS
jgi:glycosyltransferase involved in cell wall biosynthesis